jgi:hypothetical protein
MRWFHLVARSYPGLWPLRSFEPNAWMWRALRRAFPRALDVALMPNGLHLTIASNDARQLAQRLASVLRGFTRRYGHGQRLFEPVPQPAELPDRLHRWRTSRYVPLNPCRAGLARDPLEWIWSTYRDVLGATADPWVTADTQAVAHGRSRVGFEQVFHCYVSADPSVRVAGTSLPLPAPSTNVARFPLVRIQLAAGAALRVPGSQVFRCHRSRRLFAHLARDQGWPTTPIARASGISARHVRRIVVGPRALAAARLCLADERLTCGVDDLRTHPDLSQAKGVDGEDSSPLMRLSG